MPPTGAAVKGSFHARKLIRELQKRGRGLKSLLIMTHDHPDPDSLASAWALAHLVRHFCRAKTRIVYGGIIGRRENKMMAEQLAIPAFPVKAGELADWPRIALVDTQPAFKNNRFPSRRRRPDLIVDHHPRHSNTEAECAIIDEAVGATTTLLGEALLSSGVPVPRKIATAMVYGIGSETQNLGREATSRDMKVYQAFWLKANMKELWRIAYPKRPADFFSILARGIRHAFIARNIIGVHLGPLTTPDRVAQIADTLLTHEKMRWSIVTGRFKDRLHVSLRTNDPDAEAGRLLRRLLGKGKGGGHQMIAGGVVELPPEAPEFEWRQAEEKVVAEFLKAQGVEDSGARVYPFRDETA
ncbi:MAG: DHH family phosphoesterase [Elusimicrobia bacterium]|nr:DHH family phosphoesterase [Elusimicrobiota bacterium]